MKYFSIIFLFCFSGCNNNVTEQDLLIAAKSAGIDRGVCFKVFDPEKIRGNYCVKYTGELK